MKLSPENFVKVGIISIVAAAAWKLIASRLGINIPGLG